jgi:hypothetical protein
MCLAFQSFKNSKRLNGTAQGLTILDIMSVSITILGIMTLDIVILGITNNNYDSAPFKKLFL